MTNDPEGLLRELHAFQLAAEFVSHDLEVGRQIAVDRLRRGLEARGLWRGEADSQLMEDLLADRVSKDRIVASILGGRR